jgi:YggT family protein
MATAFRFIDFLYQIFYYLILARVIFSFIPLNPYDTGHILNQVRRWVYRLTEPFLGPLRRVIPPVRLGAGYLDLSPFLALMGLWLVRSFLFAILTRIFLR